MASSRDEFRAAVIRTIRERFRSKIDVPTKGHVRADEVADDRPVARHATISAPYHPQELLRKPPWPRARPHGLQVAADPKDLGVTVSCGELGKPRWFGHGVVVEECDDGTRGTIDGGLEGP
jgi:hypothetical protein